jgi:hypothetical protein
LRARAGFRPRPGHSRYTVFEVSMPNRPTRYHTLQLAGFVLLALMLAGAQASPAPKSPSPPIPGAEYSGMYSFLREGEFVQITVEDQGRVIGFVSRYAGTEGDAGFLEQLFKSGKLDGNQLAFITETVKGTWFEFRGTIDRGEGKNRGDEAYYVLKGTLVDNTIDEAKKASSHSSEVVLRSFPQNLASPQPEKK